jgi:multiple sugar transport system permease protein
MNGNERWDRWNDYLARLFQFTVITVALLITIIPFLFLFINSIKLPLEFLSTPPKIIPSQVTWEHYQEIFLVKGSATSKNLVNSLIVTSITTAISLLIGSLAAYSLARLKLPFQLTHIIGFMFLVVRFYPKITTTLPYYVLMRNFKLIDTLPAIIIAHVSITLPFAVWLMLTFFQELPKELEQSAMLDGCTPWQRFVKVIMPLAAPGLGTAAILTALVSWNEFLIASSLTSVNAKTLPVAVTSFVTDKGVLWGPMSAMSTVIVLPIMIFALFAQRYLVRGLTLGAVKE